MSPGTGASGRVVRLLAVGVIAFAASARATPADEPPALVPQPLLDRIERAALDLAKRGRRAESDTLADVAAALGDAGSKVSALREASARALAKAKPSPPPLPDVAKTLAKIASDLAATLAAQPDEAKPVVARQTIRLDASIRAAHQALGEIEHDGSWLPATFAPLLERRAAIQEAVRASRRCEVAVTNGPSTHPVLQAVHGRGGVTVASGDISLESVTVDPARIARQLRLAVQATRFVHWLLTGDMSLPKRIGPFKTLVFSTREDYRKSIDAAERSGLLTQDAAARARVIDATQVGQLRLMFAAGETAIGNWLFLDLYGDQYFEGRDLYHAPIALSAGLVNWVSVNYLGCPMPKIVWVETEEGRRGATSDTPQEEAERKEMLRMSKAGLSGLRAFLRWLSRRSEDPAWSRSMVDQMGKVAGNDLAKCTFVAEYLFETGEYVKLLRGAWDGAPGAAAFEKALGGETLAAFEHRWRAWILASDPARGLVQTLGTPPADPMTPAERACVDHLTSVRRQTLGRNSEAPGIDEELSRGCGLHARYLAIHPEQAAAWPDAHEEYPDKEGFTPEGGRAGLSSVIMPGAKGPADAIDGWMATFYHRLPLIVPGLLRIGWGHDRGFAVLDATSLAAPPDVAMSVAWPAAGATDVPRKFAPELPHPVPGEDQSKWGYPVTLQFFTTFHVPNVRMRLHQGSHRGGPEVPCHFSSPSNPTNPQLSPADAFCLIPKSALAPGTTYTVAVDGWPPELRGGADWQFTTGK